MTDCAFRKQPFQRICDPHVPRNARPVRERREWDRWRSRHIELVEHEHYQQRNTHHERHKDLDGRPRVAHAAPGKPEDGEGRAGDRDDVAADRKIGEGFDEGRGGK